MATATSAPGDLAFRIAVPADVGSLAALVESACRGDASRVGRSRHVAAVAVH